MPIAADVAGGSEKAVIADKGAAYLRRFTASYQVAVRPVTEEEVGLVVACHVPQPGNLGARIGRSKSHRGRHQVGRLKDFDALGENHGHIGQLVAVQVARTVLAVLKCSDT